MPPFLEDSKDSEQFLVMSVVVQLCTIEGLTEECYQMDIVVVSSY